MSPKTPGQIINALPVGKFANLGRVIPSGALEARKLASGTTMLYWRVTLDGKTSRVVIGAYDSGAPVKKFEPTARGYSIAAATEAARVMAQIHYTNIGAGGYAAVKTKEAAEIAAANLTVAAAARDAKENTLESLLARYCDHLEHLERSAHKDARSIFKLHIFDAWPKIAGLPANQVTGEQIADMMRRLLEKGKGRTSNKLRSYVRSAYQTARASRSKASVPVEFKGYNVTHNPASDTEPDESQNKPDKNPLNAAELRIYWQAIKAMPGIKGAALRLHLLTGAQRIEQLVKLRTINVSDSTILLFDGKGRPGKAPRPHTLPLIDSAAAALCACKPQGVFALSTDAGETHIAATTLSNWAADVASDIPAFATKRIRSGVETLLASARVASEIRGRLQSHGISGVQSRHYDAYDYLDEKRQALKTLFRLLIRQRPAT